MKSRSSIAYGVLALAALALWFARPTRKISEPDQGTSARVTAPTVPGSNAGISVSSPQATSPVIGGTVGHSTPSPAAGTITTTPSPAATPPAGTASSASADADTPKLSPDQAAQVDVTRVRHMVSDYHTLMGENPVGTNAEIMKQMMGGNSHQATLGPPDGMALNPQGELIDQWGTPFFFHQLSRDKMEVRSAGPDKIMWTADDIIAR